MHLLAPIYACLRGSSLLPRVIARPPGLPMGNAELEPLMRVQLPEGGSVRVGESFHGLPAPKIDGDPPAALAALVLSTTFARVSATAASVHAVDPRRCGASADVGAGLLAAAALSNVSAGSRIAAGHGRGQARRNPRPCGGGIAGGCFNPSALDQVYSAVPVREPRSFSMTGRLRGPSHRPVRYESGYVGWTAHAAGRVVRAGGS